MIAIDRDRDRDRVGKKLLARTKDD